MQYEWGEEFQYDGNSTPDNDGDCSGLVYATYRSMYPDVKWKNGTVWPRLTAQGYRYNAVVATAPYKVGDVPCWTNSEGRTYHIGLFIGNNETIEARGERWGVVHYKLDDPVNGVLARRAKIYRFSWVNLGSLTGSTVPPTTIPNWVELKFNMTHPDVGKLKTALNKIQNAGLTPTNFFFGAITLREVEEFQRNAGLSVDGIVGPKTRAAIAAAL